MSKLISILVGILIFCLIIVIHEMGHMLLAKANGISVPEFQIGFGPKLCSFKKGETTYSVRLIPFGGACKMLGEDGESDDERAFTNKGPWARFATVFAGPFFNFILAFIFSIIVISIVGYDPCIVTSVNEGSPVEAAGLKQGDVITKFDGTNISIGRELAVWFSLNELDGDTVAIEYEREGETFKTSFVPALSRSYKLGFYYTADTNPARISSVVAGGVLEKAGVKAGDIIIGINDAEIGTGEDLYNYIQANPLNDSETEFVLKRDEKVVTLSLVPEYTESYLPDFTYNYGYRVKTGVLGVFKYSAVELKYMIVTTIKSLGQLFKGGVSADDLGGPVRIVSELENTVEESKSDGIGYVILNLMNWAILLSANLGVMNLLPIPALDGGRLVFIIIELVRGKPVPPEKEGIVHAIGIVLLMILMVFIFFNDIRNVFF